jgi:hypothetical protein
VLINSSKNFQGGRYAEAEYQTLAAIRIEPAHPDNAMRFFNSALAATKRFDSVRALQHLDSSLTLQPHRQATW